MSNSVIVKNTFICVVEEEVDETDSASAAAETRSRARTVDVADLVRAREHEDDDEEELVTKCKSAPAAMEAGQQVASLAADLQAGGAAAAAALAEIRRSVSSLAFDAVGSSLVLHAMEVSRSSETLRIVEGLKGLVGKAARSSSACRVLEEVVRSVGAEDAAFIAEELLVESPWNLVLNANGSSITCRLMEYCASHPRTVAFVEAVLAGNVAALCGHKHGHEVAMSILSNGSPSQRGRILSALRSDVQRFARQRFSAKVFEHALTLCSEAERESLACEVLARPGTVAALACHNFGVNVVRELLQVPRASEQVRMLLAKSSGKISRDKFGSELLQELGLGKQQPKQVLDLSRELGVAERAMYSATMVAFFVGGA